MPVEFKDYYQTLGVARTASPEEIKQAFRKLARQYHPDVAKNKVVGEMKFKEINEAYEVLGDPEKKRRYDELGTNWQEGAPDPSSAGKSYRRYGSAAQRGEPDFEFGGTGFSDFFESFFGGGHDSFRSSRRGAEWAQESAAHQGEDVEADLLVSLEEALRGAVRKITLRRPAADGGTDRLDTYQVRIPAGVREGQKIRLAGQGGPGIGGSPAGDLYLRVRLARHPDFTVQESDLHCDLDLAPWEAVLGVKVRIPTLDGATSLRVPPGTAVGSQLRMRGLGLPREDGTRGDLYATVRVQTPSTVTAEERVLWEKLAKSSAFKARRRS
jgi:curved DNA-binding protein